MLSLRFVISFCLFHSFPAIINFSMQMLRNIKSLKFSDTLRCLILKKYVAPEFCASHSHQVQNLASHSK